jgi:hypothetical protein
MNWQKQEKTTITVTSPEDPEQYKLPSKKKAKERESLEEDTQLSNKVQSSGPDAAGPLLPY